MQTCELLCDLKVCVGSIMSAHKACTASDNEQQHCRGQLAADEVQLLLWQILHVLKYLHASNVWHRDLKSANVLVKLENGQRIIKV